MPSKHDDQCFCASCHQKHTPAPSERSAEPVAAGDDNIAWLMKRRFGLSRREGADVRLIVEIDEMSEVFDGPTLADVVRQARDAEARGQGGAT